MFARRILPLLCAVMVIAGCSRSHYRQKADFDAYGSIAEKSMGTPWQPPWRFSVYPDQASRWHDPSPPDQPCLPVPAPNLYSYSLPIDSSKRVADGETGDLMGGRKADENGGAADPGTSSSDTSADGSEKSEGKESEADDEPVVSPIPPDAWLDLPANCRTRMFDFESLRKEADRTNASFDQEVVAQDSNITPRLDLPDIIELALLNSRDYQTQKEALYRVALRLSLERYDYQANPTPSNNGTDLNFAHNRNGGIDIESLSIPTRIAAQKMLVTGGDVLASFANNILLTFNGPQGFAADVSSDLLFNISQPLIQRDIRFEGLTQAERNVVYAVRDFARFRKSFFADFAQQYYSLIRSYRQVEIESQNYFSLVRAFNQSEAEYRAGLVPRFQVDQVEQNLLSGRGSLIGTCNGLEQSLDGLKLNIGIPTETRINIDLSELDTLTQRDQLAVSGNLINRVQRRLTQALGEPDQVELLSTGIVLIDRLLIANDLQQRLDTEPVETAELEEQRARMLVESARLTAESIARSLASETESASPSLPVIFQRSLSLSDQLLNLAERHFELSRLLGKEPGELEAFQSRYQSLRVEADGSKTKLQEMIQQQQLQQLPQLVAETSELGDNVFRLVDELDRFNGTAANEMSTEARLENTIAQLSQLMQTTQQTLGAIGTGLEPIDIDVDDAMITALVLRFDLMNQRGSLADDWRQIKLAADDLRSVLNLNASQQISTEGGVNQPFNFTLDESRTSLGLSFDAPLNRRSQRNNFRFSLINYQASRRALGGIEDNIKFSVRNDLRNLALDREQYAIAVASAALAFERVVSTSLEFRLGTGGVSARDFLEAQTAYTDALSAVASRHINYIVDRTQLFLDLELLTVNEDGFWDELYNEEFQPQPYFEIPEWSLPAYGCLPAVRYSEEIQSLMSVPPGQPSIQQPSEF